MQNNPVGINGETVAYGIVGNPVRHSMSPEMHNTAFRELGMNCVYIALPTSSIADGFAGLKALGFRGISVTIPFKQDVMRYADVIDPVAAKIGAVNTLLIKESGASNLKTVYAYNTDWIGANRALEDKIALKDSRALVMGAGGSARAIGFGLLEAGAEVLLTNRTIEKGEKLAAQLGCEFLPMSGLKQIKTDILINATSVGMVPNVDKTPMPKEMLPNFKVVMDIVYAPLQTRLLKDAEAVGCDTVDGLAMLLYQGMAQFELWTGKDAPAKVMREVLYRRFK